MEIGILGSGLVGRTLGAKFLELGHRVTIGSRDAAKPEAIEWADAHGAAATDFAETAESAELLVNATAGIASLDVLLSIGAEALGGKVLIDVANRLDFSAGFPPFVTISHHMSLAEELQHAFPSLHVVKALNTMNAPVMVAPERVGEGVHDVFMAGDDDEAKSQVADILASFGWHRDRIRDLGGIAAARGVELYLPLWLELMRNLGTAKFNIRIVGADEAETADDDGA
ncbi:NAD(P)-binding domain-containing protein [Sinomonas sp. JGH33]|uniref:NAD(P)-binding domain-containing protein n=1 Tax=Sinomonas terricola TaxID=3110330 RepID=A0ABU5T0E2_9MICC|nr:NAD(P)-binding domain-containing protein [Sinomonas sp. JGH33]MEA5453120.1 NAD(P)-binding domain-containing protein [Sinomonas sp. JGH33]